MAASLSHIASFPTRLPTAAPWRSTTYRPPPAPGALRARSRATCAGGRPLSLLAPRATGDTPQSGGGDDGGESDAIAEACRPEAGASRTGRRAVLLLGAASAGSAWATWPSGGARTGLELPRAQAAGDAMVGRGGGTVLVTGASSGIGFSVAVRSYPTASVPARPMSSSSRKQY